MSVASIDLFAGIGGLGLGAAGAGVRPALFVELDEYACETLRLNGHLHGGEVLQADVRELHGAELREQARLAPTEKLLVTGGAPCQPFSKAAYWLEAGEDAAYRRARARGFKAPRPSAPTVVRPDGRRSLVDEFVRLVLETEADGFVFENVPSLLHPRNRPVAESMVELLSKAGYGVRILKENAAHYGVPQRRHRVFIVGAKDGNPGTPVATHASVSVADSPLLPCITSGEALAPFAGDEFFEDGEIVTGTWASHLLEVPPGGNYKHHTAWAGHPNPTFETETRFWSFLLKLDPDLPSWTVAAQPGPWVGPFHWESRRLRTPELAALQGFPNGYKFAGARRERIRQIGNAVPPVLAQRVTESLLPALAASGSRKQGAA